MDFPDFLITSNSPLSIRFKHLGFTTFSDAANFVRNLPYGRNANKSDLTTVFDDRCGTCSTKHALLQLLADENAISGIQLVLGLFRMSAENTPEIAATLSDAGLEFIPEAHNYLRHGNAILDVTNASSKSADFVDELIEEIIINPRQITDFKVAYHQNWILRWLAENPNITHSPEAIWEIREKCISNLQTSKPLQ